MTHPTTGHWQPQLPDPDLRLPRAPGVFRRWLAAHPRAVDWIIVGAYLFGCALMVTVQFVATSVAGSLGDVDPGAERQLREGLASFSWPWLPVTTLLIVVPAVALRFRRRYPVQGVVVLVLLTLLEQGLLAVPNTVALLFLIYAAAVHRSAAAGWAAYGISVGLRAVVFMVGSDTGAGLLGPAGAFVSDGSSVSARITLVVVDALTLLTVLLIGINVGNRKRYVDALIERAHQLAREREQRELLAAAGERARIAREMHDIVAHSLSVVVALSEGAAVSAQDRPEASKQAMERAAETGREALAEMRRLLGVLRDPERGVITDQEPDGEAFTPQPDVAQLPELVEGFREAGLAVTLKQSGKYAGHAGHQLTIYRIAQEGLTNALRYAGVGADVHIEVLHFPGETRVTVTDDGTRGVGSAGAGRSITGSGLGIEGARQRAQVFGGKVIAGPFGHGWRLAAKLPWQAREQGRGEAV